jgi:quinol monooxygenase YgiN
MLVVIRYRVPREEAPAFRDQAREALLALSGQPGWENGQVGRSTDDPMLWVITSQWRDVGSYRRALSSYDVKLRAVPLLSRAIDEPTAFEVLTTADAGARAVLSVTPYYNKPNRRGIVRHFSEVARAAAGTPVILYNIPGRTAVNMGPDLLAELAQIDGIEAVKQSNSAELGPIDGMTLFTGNDEDLARCLDVGGAGGIHVSSHVVGNEMHRMFDEPERRAEIHEALSPLFAAMFCTASPIPVKTALNLLGHDVGGLRLPLVEADESELAIVRNALERQGLLSGVHAA